MRVSRAVSWMVREVVRVWGRVLQLEMEKLAGGEVGGWDDREGSAGRRLEDSADAGGEDRRLKLLLQRDARPPLGVVRQRRGWKKQMQQSIFQIVKQFVWLRKWWRM